MKTFGLLAAAYGVGCALALALGAQLGSALTPRDCLPGLTQVSEGYGAYCMTPETVRRLEVGWCGAAGAFVKDRGVALIGRCVDK